MRALHALRLRLVQTNARFLERRYLEEFPVAADETNAASEYYKLKSYFGSPSPGSGLGEV